jgi:hypothetical protein
MKRLAEVPPTPIVVLLTLAGLLGVGLIWPQFAELEYAMQGRVGNGIVDYELAFSAERASTILFLWGDAGRAAAGRSLWIDFAFMPSYALLVGGLTLLIGRAMPGWWGRVGLWLALAPILAALLDAFENVMLLSILDRVRNVPPIPPLAAGVAAAIKFGLLGLAAVYWPLSGLVWLVRQAGIRDVRVE